MNKIAIEITANGYEIRANINNKETIEKHEVVKDGFASSRRVQGDF